MTQGYDKGLQADRFENLFGSCRCELCHRMTPPGVGGLIEGRGRHRCRRCNRTVCSSCSSVPGERDSRTCKECDGSSSSRRRDREKYVFLVRHAQSTWNRQLDQVKTVRHCSFPQLSVKDVVSSAAHLMTKEVWHRDHPISEEGVRQTQELQQKIAEAAGKAEETRPLDLGVYPLPGSEAVGGSSGSTCGSDSGQSHRSEENEETEAELRRVQRYYDRFLSKRHRIYCSPLLRALQTAHLVFPEENGQVSIKLLKEAREHFNFVFQRDCLGTETGTQIVDRAVQISTHHDLHSMQDRVDATDCAEKWWSEEPETEADVEARLQTLWRRLLEEDETDSCVLVTHSNLIKALLMRFGGVSDFKAQPSFNESLKEVHLDEVTSPDVVSHSSLRRLGSFCEAAGRKLFLQQEDTPSARSQPALPHLSEDEEEEPENTCSWHVVEEGPEALRKLKVERLQNCGVLGLHCVLEAPPEDTDADGWIDVNSDTELVPKNCGAGSQWVAKDALLMFGSVLVQ